MGLNQAIMMKGVAAKAQTSHLSKLNYIGIIVITSGKSSDIGLSKLYIYQQMATFSGAIL